MLVAVTERVFAEAECVDELVDVDERDEDWESAQRQEQWEVRGVRACTANSWAVRVGGSNSLDVEANSLPVAKSMPQATDAAIFKRRPQPTSSSIRSTREGDPSPQTNDTLVTQDVERPQEKTW